MTDWTGLAGEIAEVIGDTATAKLLAARGGTKIEIPKNARNSQLSRIVGQTAAQALAEHFGTGRLTLPTSWMRGQQGRKMRAIQMLRSGSSVTEVALECGLHTRTVENYMAELRHPVDGRQRRFDF